MYTVQLDFKSGLDRRRPQSAAPAGTLWECINAHITRGGDIEKRKSFVSTYDLPAAQTFGLARASEALYVFGSDASPTVPTGVTYQRLQHPDGLEMTALLDWDTFSGKIYAVAQYSDDSIHHFYDGARVTDWDDGVVRSAMTTNSGIATHLGALIDAGVSHGVGVVANVITITAAVAGTPFTLTAETENVTDGTDNQTAVAVATTNNIVASAAVVEVKATARFSVTGGTLSAGVNMVTSIKVNNVEILGATVDHDGNNTSTAAAIVTQCGTFVSSPEYTVTNSGPDITITAIAGTGAGPNGFVVQLVYAGDVTFSPTSTSMGGGVAAAAPVSAQAQISTITIGGTFEVGDRFTAIVDGAKYGAKFNPTIKGTVVLTHKKKMRACCGALLQESGVSSATAWNTADDTGANFINMANEEGGSEELTGLGPFQNNLAVFAEDVTQVWSMSADPTLNSQLQILKNTGTRAKDSVIAYGHEDLAYLDKTGIRSLRARTGLADLASVDDIGTPIDTYVQEYADTLSQAVQDAACAVIDPRDGRLWVGLGSRIFVYSSFPRAKINAWTTYEPDFTVDAMVSLNRRIYVRSGDTIYLYGGAANTTYDTSAVTVTLPFFHDNKPGTPRNLRGFDADLENLWVATMLVKPSDLTQYVDIGNLEGNSFERDGGNIGMPVKTSYSAPKLVCSSTGYARISNFAVYYDKAPAEVA